MKMIKAIIFDMDDTLAETSPIHLISFRETFQKYGVDTFTIPQEVRKTFFGRKFINNIDSMIKYFNLDLDKDVVFKELQKVGVKALEKTQPMPGYDDLIQYLKKSDLKIAVATSSPKNYADTTLSAIKFNDFYEVLVTGDEIEDTKPNPEIFLLTAKKLELAPEECVVIEDSTHGITAAHNAGMKVIGVKNSTLKTGQNVSKANIVINDLSEVAVAVNQLVD